MLALAFKLSTIPDQLRCSVTRGQVRIDVPAAIDPAIGSLAVVRAGTWYTIVDDTHRLAAFRPGTRRVTLPVSRQRAAYYRAGREHVVKAFPSRGSYRIVLADNLETEEENMSALSCTARVGG